jgi:DNA-binding SARP family transcriptional activator
MQQTEVSNGEWHTDRTARFLQLFGEPGLWWHGQRYPVARRQTQALLYYLALHRQPVTRATLCQLFWPEKPTIMAQRRLTHLLDDLNRSLPVRALLEKSKETVKLNTAGLVIDTHAFLALTTPAASIHSLLQAVHLYQAPLLTHFILPHHPAFELWLLGERATWEARYLATLARLVERQVAAEQWQGAISHALCYLYHNGADEAMHRTLIELYGRLGDRNALQRQYRWCVRVLAHEVGAQPTATTEAAYAAAQQAADAVRFLRYPDKL